MYTPIAGATTYNETNLPAPTEPAAPTGSPDDVVYNEKLIQSSTPVRQQLFGNISSANDMYGTFTVSTTAVAGLSLANGMVLAFPDSPQTPGGAVVAIDSVTRNPATDTVTIVTRQADVGDIIVQTDGLTDLSSLVRDVNVTPADGVSFTGTFDPSGSEWDFARSNETSGDTARVAPNGFAPAADPVKVPLVNRSFTVDLKKNLAGVDAAQITGGVEVTVKVLADIDANPLVRNHIRQFKVVASTVIWGDIDFEARKAFAASLERKLADVTASIGIGPATLNFNSSIDLETSLSAAASFQYKPKVNIGVSTGVEYTGGAMRPVQQKWFSANSTKPYLTGDLDFSIGTRPKLEASLQALGSKFVSVYGSATGQGKFNARVETGKPVACGFTGQVKLDFSAWALALSSLSVGTGWMDVYKSGNLCEGLTPVDPGPEPFDPGNVVPRGQLRNEINSQLGVSDWDAPISQEQMKRVTSVRYPSYGGIDLEGLQYASNLEVLIAQASKVPDLSRLPRLRSLDLSGTFDSLPASQVFPALNFLSLSVENLDAIPANIVAGGRLTSIRLQGNGKGIRELPNEIGNNSQLSEVWIHQTTLHTLPESFGQLYSLSNLRLEGNTNLTALPESIGNLAHLTNLNVDSGDLRLPESFGRLAALQSLSVSATGRLQLPESFGNLYNLQLLYIRAGVLRSLPASFTSLHSLKVLDLAVSSGITLPADMSGLVGLDTFRYSDPTATTVPDSIGTVPNLVTLNLWYSPIVRLPEFLYQMTQRETGTKLDRIYLQVYRVDKSTETYKKLTAAGVLINDFQ